MQYKQIQKQPNSNKISPTTIKQVTQKYTKGSPGIAHPVPRPPSPAGGGGWGSSLITSFETGADHPGERAARPWHNSPHEKNFLAEPQSRRGLSQSEHCTLRTLRLCERFCSSSRVREEIGKEAAHSDRLHPDELSRVPAGTRRGDPARTGQARRTHRLSSAVGAGESARAARASLARRRRCWRRRSSSSRGGRRASRPRRRAGCARGR